MSVQFDLKGFHWYWGLGVIEVLNLLPECLFSSQPIFLNEESGRIISKKWSEYTLDTQPILTPGGYSGHTCRILSTLPPCGGPLYLKIFSSLLAFSSILGNLRSKSEDVRALRNVIPFWSIFGT